VQEVLGRNLLRYGNADRETHPVQHGSLTLPAGPVRRIGGVADVGGDFPY
jgi:hypothetical protein